MSQASLAADRRNRPVVGISFALASTVLYGVVPAGTGLAFQNGVSPIEVTFFRTALVALGMLAIALVMREKLRFPRGLSRVFWLQAFATLVISVGFLGAVAFIPVSLTILIFYTFPILTVMSGPFIEGKKLRPAQIVAVVLAFIGLGVAVGPSLDVLDWRGIALAGAAAVAVVAQFHCARSLGGAMAPAVQGFFIHAAILPATLGLALWIGGGSIPFLSGGNMAGLLPLVLVGVCYLIAFFLHMSALAAAPASTVVPFYNLEPVISITMAAVLVREFLTPVQYFGVGLVLAGLLITSLAERKSA
jgi:drug/metabolite transporter (DMT)-like permease